MIALPREALRGLGRLEASAEEITGVQVDSRRIEPGDLFVAVPGGELFLAAARERGAAATLVPNDPHTALATIAGLVRDRSDARFVGITGSMGKTTTKDILAALCRPHRRTIAAESSFNNEIGVPLTVCRVESDTEVCVLELAMRGFGQIAELCGFARPHVGVVTNVGPVHLEKVGDLAGVVRAKSELLEALPPGGTAIVPADFPVARQDLDVVRVFEDVRLLSFENGIAETTLGPVRVDFTARHLAENLLFALAAARALGVPHPQKQLDIAFAAWRNQELELAGGGLLINDAWNANPVSMAAALRHLVERAAGRRTVAVLGDMAELGVESAAHHAAVGSAASAAGIDLVVAVGPQAEAYGGMHVATVPEALVLLERELRPGDAVLLKGARSMGLEGIAAALTNVPA